MKFSSFFLLFAFAGFGVSLYDAYDILTQSFNTCNINAWLSCGAVFQSGHNSIGGIPFWVLGIGWFVFIISAIVFVTRRSRHIGASTLAFFIPLLMIGNIFTVYLWYLQLAVIHVLCPVCITMYAINYTMTGLALVQIFRIS